MKLIFSLQIKIKVFCKLMLLSYWVCVCRHEQSNENKKCAYLSNISMKTWGIKLIFCLFIYKDVFYKLIVILQVCLARHTQSTQNNKITISLQYLMENVKDEVDFLPANKHQSFLETDIINLGVWRSMPILPKVAILLFLFFAIS